MTIRVRVIRRIVVAAMALTSYQALAQEPFVPQNIQQLQQVLTTNPIQAGQLIEIPANLAKDWIQPNDQTTWAALQQRRPAKINLESLLSPRHLSVERLTDGIDPFAIYDKNGDLMKIRIRGYGAESLNFFNTTIREASAQGECAKSIIAATNDAEWSSLTHKLIAKAQEAAAAICDMPVQPEQVSVSTGVDIFWVGLVEATFNTVKLCGWLGGHKCP